MAVFDVSQSVIAQAGGLIQGSTDVSADMLAELETSLGGDGLGAAFGAVAAVCAHWLHDEGDGNYHFRFGVWQDAGNLSADQSGPHPRCYAFQPGAWWHRAELHQVPVCCGLSRAADPCMCCNLRSAHSSIATGGDPIGAIWGTVGYTVLLCFMLFKTGSIAQRIFGAH